MNEHPLKTYCLSKGIDFKVCGAAIGVVPYTMSRYFTGQLNPSDVKKVKIQEFTKNKVKVIDLINWKILFDERD